MQRGITDRQCMCGIQEWIKHRDTGRKRKGDDMYTNTDFINECLGIFRQTEGNTADIPGIGEVLKENKQEP